ncbi:MAG: SMP-30/gluconolactonase/LRE family protein [Melioribacter sp.]|uniref:SMP-30/gluconolactonase/LRE family protein n=1 Tax=Rosettibacter primus TaxID=3111523 RepID=UPI00247E25E1|nr:SMP-30/gluconolactonase/LRE family protein [Melioribacter sp.]
MRSIKLFLMVLFLFINQLFSQSINTKGIIVEKIADGFQFVEGPVWKDGALYFSDIPANTIYRWKPDSGISVFLKPSGNSNGLALDKNGNLLLAQHGLRQVARLEKNGTLTPLATHYDGKRLNSPNDIAVKSDGSIFFTDPPYGINSSQEELRFYGIYRISVSGNLQLLDKSLFRPNGIAFSPDEKKLYVSDSEARIIYVWDVISDSTIANKKRFASMAPQGYADGMKVDKYGFIFEAGPIGIWVFSPEGTVVDTIPIPGQTTNCCFGEDGRTLFVTSGNAVYRVKNIYTDIQEEEKLDSKSFQLNYNYPNPFNNETIISYSIKEPAFVKLILFDELGRKVQTLINEYQSANTYRVSFNAENLSSGVYFYQLSANNKYSETKKMILIR